MDTIVLQVKNILVSLCAVHLFNSNIHVESIDNKIVDFWRLPKPY